MHNEDVINANILFCEEGREREGCGNWKKKLIGAADKC